MGGWLRCIGWGGLRGCGLCRVVGGCGVTVMHAFKVDVGGHSEFTLCLSVRLCLSCGLCVCVCVCVYVCMCVYARACAHHAPVCCIVREHIP